MQIQALCPPRAWRDGVEVDLGSTSQRAVPGPLVLAGGQPVTIAGLITRTRSHEDLRGFEVRLTPAGRRALARANLQHLQDVQELFFSHVTHEELRFLADIWRRIKAANKDLDNAG